MNSNEIDKLFKSKLEQHQIPFDESSWLKAQALLDEKMPVESGSKNRTLMYWAVAASIIAFVAYFGVNDTELEASTQMAEQTMPLDESNSAKEKVTSQNTIQEESVSKQTVNSSAHTNSTFEPTNTTQSTPPTVSNTTNLLASAGSPFTSGNVPSNGTSNAQLNAVETESNDHTNNTTEIKRLQSKFAFLNHTNLQSEVVALNSAEDIQEVIKPVRDISYYSWGISIFGGLNFMPSLNPEVSNLGVGGNVGLVAQKNISDKIAFKTGLNYELLNGINLEETAVEDNYSFGLTQKTTTKTTNQVHQLNVPISIEYSLSKHQFELGANFSYGLFTNTTTNSTSQGNFESTSTSDNTVGFNPEINRFNYGLLAGYQYQIDDKGAIGIQTQYNLSSMVSDDSFKQPFITRFFLALKIK